MTSLRSLARHPLLRALLLLALALRAATPAGVMVSGDVAGGFEVQLCTASGLQSLVLPGEPDAPPTGAQHDAGVCLFSLVAGAALAPDAGLAPRTHALPALAVPRGTPLRYVAAIQRTQSSRGPPTRLPA